MRRGKLFVSVLLALLLTLLPMTALPRECTTGQPCGNSCISWQDECHVDDRRQREDGGDVLLAALALVLAVGALVGMLVYAVGEQRQQQASEAGR
jgi:hypothetical protein